MENIASQPIQQTVMECAEGSDSSQANVSYLLRGLMFPQVQEESNPEMANRGLSYLQVSHQAEVELAQRSESIKIIAAQIAFLSCVFASKVDFSSLPIRDHSSGKGGPLVTVIGCGMLGSQILKSLIAIGWPPSCLGACSRNEPHFLEFVSLGVQCTTDASVFDKYRSKDPMVDDIGRMIVIAVPYAQLRALTSSLSNSINTDKTVIISSVAGTTYSKLRQLLPQFPHIIRTVVQLSKLEAKTVEEHSANEDYSLLTDHIIDQAASHMCCDDVSHIVSTFTNFYHASGMKRDQANEQCLENMFGATTGSASLDRGDIDDASFGPHYIASRFHKILAQSSETATL